MSRESATRQPRSVHGSRASGTAGLATTGPSASTSLRKPPHAAFPVVMPLRTRRYQEHDDVEGGSAFRVGSWESSMRMMMMVEMDTAITSNTVRDGGVTRVMQSTMEALKPEAAYFGPYNGHRTAFIIFDMDDPSRLPAISEPLYRELGAHLNFFPVMDQPDLQRGLSALGNND